MRRTAAHSTAQGVKVATRLRRQKNQRLLRFSGDGDKHTLLTRTAGPGLHACKPLRRRRIGDPAQEAYDQHIMRGLALRQVGMNPEPVTGQQVWHLADGQRNLSTFHMHVDLWTHQVKGRVGGVQSD